MKADKIVGNAKQEAAKVKAHVYEQTERTIADCTAKAEKVRLTSYATRSAITMTCFTFFIIVHILQEKAAEEEARKRDIAELVDEVEQMKATGELPIHEKKGVITRLKEKVVGHH